MNAKGYGSFRIGSRTDGSRRRESAHRVSWRLYRGDPGAMHVLHRCDVPGCVNPDHLFLGTNADNVADKQAKGRGARLAGETNGRARLTDRDVAHLRTLSAGGATQVRLAQIFGVSQAHVSRIVRGQNRVEAASC